MLKTKYKKYLSLTFLLILQGCSSFSQMREDGPMDSFTSAKSEDDVAQCILTAFQNQSMAGVHYDFVIQKRPIKGLTVAVIGSSQREMADIYKLGQK
jgi:hypothetical protein